MELKHYGLLRKWETQSIPQPNRNCSFVVLQQQATLPRIFFPDLIGAFVLLAVGMSLATLAFLVEKIRTTFYHHLNRTK